MLYKCREHTQPFNSNPCAGMKNEVSVEPAFLFPTSCLRNTATPELAVPRQYVNPGFVKV